MLSKVTTTTIVVFKEDGVVKLVTDELVYVPEL